MLNFDNAKIIVDQNPFIAKLQNPLFFITLGIFIMFMIFIFVFTREMEKDSRIGIGVFFAIFFSIISFVAFQGGNNSTAKIEVINLSKEEMMTVSNNSPNNFVFEGDKLYYKFRTNTESYKNKEWPATKIKDWFEYDLTEALNKNKKVEIIKQNED